MREIEIAGSGRVLIPDSWSDEQVKSYILELNLPTEAASQVPEDYSGILVDWTANPKSPRVTGDIQSLTCASKLTWGEDGFWHCLPFDVEDLRVSSVTVGIEFKEIMAELAPPPPKKARAAKQEAKQEVSSSPVKETGASKSAGGTVAGESKTAEPTHFAGTVSTIEERKSSKQTPFLAVTVISGKRSVRFTSWNKHVNEFIRNAKGKGGIFIVEHLDGQYPGILGLKELNGQHFDSDGKTPVIQRSEQQAGGQTLFG